MRQQDIEYLKKEGLPVYIWGGGDVAGRQKTALERNGIPCAGFVIDDVKPNAAETVSKEELILSGKKYALIRGFLGAFYPSEEELLQQWPNCQRVLMISDMYEPDTVGPMSQSFYNQHQADFMRVRSDLADQLSRDSFDAFLSAKLTLTSERIAPFVVKKQYFFPDAPWTYDEKDVLLDCGAFNGDSIMDFVALRGAAYKKIIACEPDEQNYKDLLENMKANGIHDVEAHLCGLYREKTTLRFTSSGDMESYFDENGDIELPVDSIDNLSGGQDTSIIKMDIEGSEMDALRGAVNTIKRCRPILMISAYHKKEDLYTIYDFIKQTVDGYKFFFRCHKPIALDAVMYAVPEERCVGGVSFTC